MFSRVLMVCVGNICRSPMAEALLSDRLARRGVKASVQSAGIAALVGRPADPLAQVLMRERGIDISAHRARQLTPALVASAELVLVMEKGHEKALSAITPSAKGRVHLLGKFGSFEVPDPYGGTRATFERALELIERGIGEFERAFWSRPG